MQRRRLHKCQNEELLQEYRDYFKIRLPEKDIKMLQNYLKLAVVIEVDSINVLRCRITELKLLRLKIHKEGVIQKPKAPPKSTIGCHLLYEFYLHPKQIDMDQVVRE